MKCYLVEMVGIDDKLVNFDVVAEIKGKGERVLVGHVVAINNMVKQCYGAYGARKVADKTYAVQTTVWAESQREALSNYPAKDYYQYAIEMFKKEEQEERDLKDILLDIPL